LAPVQPRSGDAIVGAGWPLMTNDLKKAGLPVAEVIPHHVPVHPHRADRGRAPRLRALLRRDRGHVLLISLLMIATAACLMRNEGAASRVVQGK
jgi:hypothetical protein